MIEINNVYLEDNFLFLQQLEDNFIHLIYMDIPYFTQKQQIGKTASYNDKWKSLLDYLNYMSKILKQCKRVLLDNGSIYIHSDYHSVHYIKILMDRIFGFKNFLNEVIWKRAIGKNAKNKMGYSHDTILLYVTNPNDYYFKPQFKNLTESTLKRYNKKDEKGLYMEQTITAPNSNNIWDFELGEKKPVLGRGYAWKKDKIEKYIEKGFIFKSSKGNLVIKRYLKDSRGSPISTIWDDIHFVINPEDTGYPSQKPEALLERIIQMSSKDTDIVGDFFCGSGTTLAVAKRLGRSYIGCDSNPKAIEITKERLKKINLYQDIRNFI